MDPRTDRRERARATPAVERRLGRNAASAVVAIVLLGACDGAKRGPGGPDAGDATARWFAEEVARRTAPGDTVVLHASLPGRDAVRAALARPTQDVGALTDVLPIVAANPRTVVLMGAAPSGLERSMFVELLRRYAVWAFGDRAILDLRSSGPEIHELRFVEARFSFGHRFEEVAGPFLLCASTDAEVPPGPDAPEAPTPPAAAMDLARCHYNYQILRGDLSRARRDLVEWGSAPGGLESRDALLGDMGRVVGIRLRGRTGAEVWWTIGRPPPVGTVLRWSAVSAHRPPFVEDHPAWVHPSGRPATPGFLVIDSVAWFLPPGDYHLSVDLVPPASAAAVAPAHADLGDVHLQ
jgi:hypothetical protein